MTRALQFSKIGSTLNPASFPTTFESLRGPTGTLIAHVIVAAETGHANFLSIVSKCLCEEAGDNAANSFVPKGVSDRFN